jgi:hypothetical protein
MSGEERQREEERVHRGKEGNVEKLQNRRVMTIRPIRSYQERKEAQRTS